MCIFLLSKLHRNKEEIQRKEAHRQSAKGKKKKKEGITKIKHTGQRVESKNTRTILPIQTKSKGRQASNHVSFSPIKNTRKKNLLWFKLPNSNEKIISKATK